MRCRSCGGKISLRNKREHFLRMHIDRKECVLNMLNEKIPEVYNYEIEIIETTEKPKKSSVIMRKPKQRHLIVYKHTHKESGLSYYGSTINGMEYRLKGHIRDSENGSNLKFHRMLRKFGVDSFESEIIEDLGHEYSKELEIELRELEKQHIINNNAVENGLNMIVEFEGGQTEGQKFDDGKIKIKRNYKNGLSSADSRRGKSQIHGKNKDCPKYISRRNGKLFVNIQWDRKNGGYFQKVVKSIDEGKKIINALWEATPKLQERGESPYKNDV